MSTVSLQHVGKCFGNCEVLKDISLDVGSGEFMALIGPSGCGKSTLLRIIAGLERQTQGDVGIGGANVNEQRPRDRDVAMVFQSYALYPHLSVFDNMALPLRMRRLRNYQRLPLIGRWVPGTKARQRRITDDVQAVATSIHIEHLLDRKPGQLSGGQRQRVALGRAMVRDPRVFLMDEPLSNLDAKLRVQLRSEIAQLHRKLGATFIYVTHDQVEAMTMSNRLAVMMDGKILQTGSPKEVYGQPADVRIAEFIGSPKINLVPATVGENGGIDILDQRLPLKTSLPAGSKLQIGIRPEAFGLLNGSNEPGLSIFVEHMENMGSDILVHGRHEYLDIPIISRLNPKEGDLVQLGTPLRLRLPHQRSLIFDHHGKRIASEMSHA
jgi:multiple sugar transport system ATP-binding protein